MRNNLFSPSQPINHSVSERVSLSASTRLEKLFRNKRKGSVTVEAAATVPLFFLAVVTLLYLLEMMAVHTAVRSSLQYAGKQVAKDTCITQMLMPSKVERERQGWKEVSLQAAAVGWTVRHQECLCVPGLEH